MTHEEFQQKLKEIPNLELATKAQMALSNLCNTGGKSFVMSIPAKLDDTDMIFSELITRFEQLALSAHKL